MVPVISGQNVVYVQSVQTPQYAQADAQRQQPGVQFLQPSASNTMYTVELPMAAPSNQVSQAVIN